MVASQARGASDQGQVFEVPGCGGFLLTEDAPHLERYFEPNSEIALWDSVPALVDKVQWWLNHETERSTVALAGRARVEREYTYDRRFEELFRAGGVE